MWRSTESHIGAQATKLLATGSFKPGSSALLVRSHFQEWPGIVFIWYVSGIALHLPPANTLNNLDVLHPHNKGFQAKFSMDLAHLTFFFFFRQCGVEGMETCFIFFTSCLLSYILLTQDFLGQIFPHQMWMIYCDLFDRTQLFNYQCWFI